jgi:DNA-binding SARP family transcriptional activator
MLYWREQLESMLPMTLRIQLFGPHQATWQDAPLSPLRLPRVQSLWAYLLLLHRHRPAPREHLAFSFWPDVPEDEARANLRQDLLKLRRWLPPADDPPWLLADSDEVGIHPEAPIWVDVWAFEDGLTRGEAELEAAVRLVTADLLPHLYDDWLLLERERLRGSYARALTRLVTLYQSLRAWAQALTWANRLVTHDPLNEEAHRLLIGLYYASGNRAAALRQFEQCQRLLRDELGVEPMPETLALRDAILRGEPLKQQGSRGAEGQGGRGRRRMGVWKAGDEAACLTWWGFVTGRRQSEFFGWIGFRP